MAKTVDEAKAVDIAGKVPALPVPTRIHSEEEAIAFVKNGSFDIPSGCDTIYVTEDKNVFLKQHADAAFNHAFKQNLKLFTLNEWTK